MVHYEPHGPGVRFADESLANIYPWENIFAALGMFAAAFTLFEFGRRGEASLANLPPQSDRVPQSSVASDPSEDNDPNEVIDLKLH